ncbi:hypothetical protein V5799_015162, partial [Amblyomma americanum]
MRSSATPKILPFAFPRTLTVGETTSVTCTTAAGDESFKYLWLKDGSAVRPGDNVKIVTSPDISVLKIDKLTLDDAGNYTCVASNAGGTVSHASSLEIKAPPQWKTEPHDTTVSAGQQVSIVCEGFGHPTPTVMWRVKGTGKTFDTSAGKLSLPSASKENQGSYTCEIFNGIGEPLRKTVTLFVKSNQPYTHLPYAPFVSAKFSSSFAQATESGVSVRISSVVWRQGSFASKTIADVQHERNAAAITLLAVRATREECTRSDCDHCCVIKSGEQLSPVSILADAMKSWSLWVLFLHCTFWKQLQAAVPPSIAPFLFPKNLEVQQRISVMCTISVGERPLRFAWLKDGSALTSGSKNVRIVDNAEYSTLHIDVLTLDSAGNYTCSVTNKAGYASHTAPLVVHGDETPYTTVHDDPGSSSIVIQNAGKHHQGSYTCRVSNGVGPELLKTVTVKIKPPKIQPFTFPATLNAGERSGTMCIVSAGDKPLTFSWFKDGSTLMTSDNVKVASSAEFSSLNFGSLDVSHTGNYTCSVRNSVGSASFTAFLAVHSPPAWAEVSRDKVLTAGESGSLVCNAHGFPAPIIRWFKTGMEASVDVGLEHENGTIKIASAKKEHQGSYKCVADNGVGAPISRVVRLEVK